MTAPQRSQWRTVVTVLVLAAVMLAALVLCLRAPGEFGARMFDTLCYSMLGLAFVQAGKSGVEHLAAGGGVKGAVAALMTDAKPGEPVPEIKP